MTKCKICERSLVKVKGKKHRDFYYYVDHEKRKWNGRVCPDCAVNEQRVRSGGWTMDNPKNKIHKMARDCEWQAARYFESLGYSATVGRGKGPDIFLSKDGKNITCEVKMISFHAGSYRVSSVLDSRKNDDLIALVFPNKFVFHEPLTDHLKKCAAHGGRTVTSLCRAHF